MIRRTPLKQYELATEGIHRARLKEIRELDPALNSKGEKQPRLRFIWELSDRVNSLGESIRVFATYNVSLHPKSFLARAIVDLTGREPGQEFDLDSLVGVEAELVVKHNQASNGRMYANVGSILRPQTAAEEAGEKRVRAATQKAKNQESTDNDDIPF
jgi:hypothetical protein